VESRCDRNFVFATNSHNRFYPVPVGSAISLFSDPKSFPDAIAAESPDVERIPRACIAQRCYRKPDSIDATTAHVQHRKSASTDATATPVQHCEPDTADATAANVQHREPDDTSTTCADVRHCNPDAAHTTNADEPFSEPDHNATTANV
jgi:hypothetical protein